MFKDGTAWPEVIGELQIQASRTSCADHNRTQRYHHWAIEIRFLIDLDGRFHDPDTELMFPAFHPEILQQPRWDPAEPLGRIQVVLTEGVLKESMNSQMTTSKMSFDGLRDVVAFAFQHAPQGLCEAEIFELC